MATFCLCRCNSAFPCVGATAPATDMLQATILITSLRNCVLRWCEILSCPTTESLARLGGPKQRASTVCPPASTKGLVLVEKGTQFTIRVEASMACILRIAVKIFAPEHGRKSFLGLVCIFATSLLAENRRQFVFAAQKCGVSWPRRTTSERTSAARNQQVRVASQHDCGVGGGVSAFNQVNRACVTSYDTPCPLLWSLMDDGDMCKAPSDYQVNSDALHTKSQTLKNRARVAASSTSPNTEPPRDRNLVHAAIDSSSLCESA